MRCRRSRSTSAYSASVISPSSSRIWAASSSSRRALSSVSSASTAAAILPRTNRRPPMTRLSMMIIGDRTRPHRASASRSPGTPSAAATRSLLRTLELQPDVHEVVRRPWPGVAEVELVVPGPDLLHLRVEGPLLVPGDQEGGVHDHLVA